MAFLNRAKKYREERRKEIERILNKMDQLAKDERYTEEYKREQLAALQQELAVVRGHYDRKIREEIEGGRRDAMARLQAAEFKDMTEKQILAKMLHDQRRFYQEQRLVAIYKDRPEDLVQATERAVANDDYYAISYINALEQVNKDPFYNTQIQALRREYEERHMNYDQKQQLEILKELDELEREYEKEIADEKFVAALRDQQWSAEDGDAE